MFISTDFGLAHKFSSTHCVSSKYVGKRAYKSPEIINRKRQFDAKSSDIWSLGVCFFMIMIGSAPWDIANHSDERYALHCKGKLSKLLRSWDRASYVNASLIHLFESIFQCEKNRMNLQQIADYSWFK